MGGTRCNFRNCHVNNAKFPRMHFFRFPIKEPERVKKWIQYSQMERMSQFTETRKKNTCICARHFRVECFMNYKMDKLAPSAVPTLMRLSKNQALDFELDIEIGVLVTLEDTKLKHLIPPDGFENPFYLENDIILMNILTETKKQQTTSTIVEESAGYIEGEREEYEPSISQRPVKSPSNSVEILETIKFLAPTYKRSRENIGGEVETNAVDSANVKKFKILNSAHCSLVKENQTNVTLTPQTGQNNSSNRVIVVDNTEFINSNNRQLHSTYTFADAGYSEISNEENLEIIELHGVDTESLADFAEFESESTIVQLETNPQSIKESINDQISNSEIERLQLKITLLENENYRLKETCKEIEELHRKLITLKTENNRMKCLSEEHKILKEKCAEYSEENRKLKVENEGVVSLKAKLLARQQETVKLKKIIESLKTATANENTLKDDITAPQKPIQTKENQLSNAKTETHKIKAAFNATKNEKENLIKSKHELEENSEGNVANEKNDFKALNTNFINLQKKHFDLEQKYLKLHALQSQEATVSTSLENSSVKIKTATASTTRSTSLTKPQLFNGIKRYLSSAMVSLLRMEMFGSSEREWKSDERRVALDILRLGEPIYKYFIDEWRFRLPALCDVRNWLNQSIQMDEEEDL